MAIHIKLQDSYYEESLRWIPCNCALTTHYTTLHTRHGMIFKYIILKYFLSNLIKGKYFVLFKYLLFDEPTHIFILFCAANRPGAEVVLLSWGNRTLSRNYPRTIMWSASFRVDMMMFANALNQLWLKSIILFQMMRRERRRRVKTRARRENKYFP